MNKYPLWRYLLIIALVALSVIYALPNLYGEDPAIEIKINAATRDTNAVAASVAATLKKANISVRAIEPSAKQILVRLQHSNQQLDAQAQISTLLGASATVALNLASRTPAWLLHIGAQPMKLGLDLRGGVHFLIDVDTHSMIKNRLQADMRAIALMLRKNKLRYAGISLDDKALKMSIAFNSIRNRDQAIALLSRDYRDYQFKATAIGNAEYIEGSLTKSAINTQNNYAVDQNLTILNNRVNELGIAEPVIQRQGATQISVDLPGVQDMARAKDLIGKMATVKMQLVDSSHDAETAQETGIVPFGTSLKKDEYQRPILLKNQVILSGSSIINANATVDENGRPAVSLRIAGSAISQFNQITGENIGQPMAVLYVENKNITEEKGGKPVTTTRTIERIINVATINSALGGNFQIMGLTSMEYAKNLAVLLRSGAYKARMSFVQERVVGPSLGQKNIHMGMLSLEIGALAVFVFMLLYYRLFGVVANVALILNLVFIVAIQSALGATMTLAGMAALVLTVGMAVDANVLINERIREELRLGVSAQAAIASGYARAFSTIVDANITTLIVAVILLSIGSSAVQGFAVTLIIGLLTSMITAIFFTRALVNLIYGRRRRIDQLSIGIQV